MNSLKQYKGAQVVIVLKKHIYWNCIKIASKIIYNSNLKRWKNKTNIQAAIMQPEKSAESRTHSQHSLKQRNENQLPSVDIGCLHTLGWKCFWDYLHVIYNTYKHTHLLFSNFSSHKYGHISAIIFK